MSSPMLHDDSERKPGFQVQVGASSPHLASNTELRDSSEYAGSAQDQLPQANKMTKSIAVLERDQLNDPEETISSQDGEFPIPSDGLLSIKYRTTALLSHYAQQRQQHDVDEGISLLREALDLCPQPHPEHASCLENLADTLWIRFEHVGEQSDLDEVIQLISQILGLLPLSHPEYSSILNKLGLALKARFRKYGQLPDLDNAVTTLRKALQRRLPSHPDYSLSLNSLANVLLVQFEHNHQDSALDEAIDLYRQALDLRPPSHRPRFDRFLSLNNLANAMWTRFSHSGGRRNLDQSTQLFRQALDLLPPTHPDYHLSLNKLATALNAKFRESGKRRHIDEAILLLRKALNPSHLGYIHCLENLLDALWDRNQDGEQRDLEEIIRSSRGVIKALPPTDPNCISFSRRLGFALMARSRIRAQPDDLNKAILSFRRAVDLLPPLYPNRSTVLGDLGTALRSRFNKGESLDDINEAILFHKEAFDSCPPSHPNYRSFLAQVVMSMKVRLRKGPQENDLRELLPLLRKAVDLCPQSDPNRSVLLEDLARGLMTEYMRDCQIYDHDLDEACVLLKEAFRLDMNFPDRLIDRRPFEDLADMLTNRFDQTHRGSDIKDSVLIHRHILQLLPPSDPSYSSSLNNLAVSLESRFNHGNVLDDLHESIRLHRQALQLRPQSHPERTQSLENLSKVLIARYEEDGQHADDLDEAVALLNQAFELERELGPSDGKLDHEFFSDLADLLMDLYDQRGYQSDIDNAVVMDRQALDLCSLDDPLYPDFLNDLAETLEARFRHGNMLNDLHESTKLHREALSLRPRPHPDRDESLENLANNLVAEYRSDDGQQLHIDEAITLLREAHETHLPIVGHRLSVMSSLADALLTQFKSQDPAGNQEILEECISLYREASILASTDPPSPYPTFQFEGLAEALHSRFIRNANHGDIEEAIMLLKQVLNSPNPNPRRPSVLLQLGEAYTAYTEKLDGLGNIEEAMSLFREATQLSLQSAEDSFNAASTWVQYAERHQHPSTIDAYDALLSAVPRLAAVSLNAKLRRNSLRAGTDGIARRAARWAIRAGHLDRAVEYLEAGRGVFWSQFTHLRSPFDDLRSVDFELANTLASVASDLESASHRATPSTKADNRQKIRLQHETSRINRLAEKWSKLLDEARLKPGFGDFLKPPRSSILMKAAQGNPIVLLVSNDDSSDCLIMTSTKVDHVPLPTLSASVLGELVRLVSSASSGADVSRSSAEENVTDIIFDDSSPMDLEVRGFKRRQPFSRKRSSDDIFRSVLVTLWEEVVKPVIDFLHIQKSQLEDVLPILHWCPTGLFSSLPIHAAGSYNSRQQPFECANDYFVSSYTPTIGALLTPDPPSTSQHSQMLVVVDFETLQSTKEELTMIQQHVSKDILTVLGTPDAPATVEGVAGRLKEMSIVHFACHGTNRPNSLRSGLRVAPPSGELYISRIMRENIPRGSLAYLSACETAVGDATLPDEAISLGASLIFCGFRHVVATMWKMCDLDGPSVADVVYKELFRGSDGRTNQQPDCTKSARALHMAVQQLRSDGVPFHRWVLFIHMGK